MSRKNIFELLAEKYNVEEEFKVILHLFNQKILAEYSNSVNGTPISIEQAVDNMCFYSWKQRGSCLNSRCMKEKLGLNNCDISKLHSKIHCLEYICNLINLVNTKLLYPIFQKTKEFVMLEQNIDLFLEHINFEKIFFKEEEKIIIVPKFPEATAAAEISTPDIAYAILKYHHASLKGNLLEKRKLLLSIANEYEPLLSKPVEGFSDYYTKTTNMLNNLNVRHNNKSGKKKNNLVVNMQDDELEFWYDELYQLLLFCILIAENKTRKEKVGELLKKLKAEEK